MSDWTGLVVLLCALGVWVAGAVWINLKVADLKVKVTPREREEFERETDDEMRNW